MKRYVERVMLLLILFFGFFISINEVNAITVTEERYINFNTYGLDANGTTHYRTSIKKSDGKDVFCIQYKKNFTAGVYTKNNCSNNGTTKGITNTHLVVAGQIVSLVDDKEWSADKKYAYKVATLNTYFKSLNLKLSAGSIKFTGNDQISNIIKNAKANAKYYGTNKTKNISKPNIAVDSSKILNLVKASNNTFVSNKITFGNLNASFNGIKPEYKFTTSGTGTFYLCTSKTGGCKPIEDVTVSGKESVSYYLKVVGAKTDSSVSVTIKATSSADYPKASIYCKGTSNQSVLMTSTETQTYSNYRKVTFQVPDTTKHQISILKVDESGESIDGSEFELYVKGSNNKLTLNQKGSLFTYVSDTVASNNDDFFNKEYCYRETKNPDGYRNGGEACIKVGSNTKGAVCYNNETSEQESDSDFCNTNISYMCENVKEVVLITPNDDGTNNETVISSSKEYTELAEAGCVASESTTTKTETGEEKTNYTASKKCVLKNDDGSYTEKDAKYCDNVDNYTLIEVSSGNIFITVPNQKNSVIISKKEATGKEEVAGATLKICTANDYKKNSVNCSAAKTVGDVELSWLSSDSPAEFSGIKAGTYYIIEETPPAGYKLSATIATEFSIDKDGVVKTGETEVKDNVVVINNSLNELYISKTDIATNKELPGATLSICTTVTKNIDTNDTEEDEDDTEISTEVSGKKYILELDQNGDCLPASLANGTEATWVSTDKPYKIQGLPAGTYYLVEKIPPANYSVAESILFTMNDDGTLADGEGKLIGDNKIVMLDDPIVNEETGNLATYIVIGSLILVTIIGVFSYIYLKKNNVKIFKK